MRQTDEPNKRIKQMKQMKRFRVIDELYNQTFLIRYNHKYGIWQEFSDYAERWINMPDCFGELDEYLIDLGCELEEI